MEKTAIPALTRHGARVAPLSFAQERLWFIDAAAPGSATYNVPLLMRWKEAVDVTALKTSFRAVARRHEVLRTVYRLQEGRPVQAVTDDDEIPVEVVDVAGPGAWDEARADALRRGRHPFDLAAGAPVRATVWRGVPGGDVVLLSIHHIAVDGWSLASLFEDLAHAYGAAVVGGEPHLPELPIQYADFAIWDREMFETPSMRRRLSSRVDELVEVPGDLVLGGRRPPPVTAEGSRRGQQYLFELPGPTWSRVKELALALRVTPFVILFSAYQVVLHRWSEREEFLVGTVMANRPHPELEELIGFFVNTVPLRCRLAPDWSFSKLCTEVRTEAFKAQTYQRLPFDQIVARVASLRPEGRTSLATCGFALQNMPAPRVLGRPRWNPATLLPTGTAKFEFALILEEVGDAMLGTLEYNVDCYSADAARQFGENFRVLLAAGVAQPDRAISRLPITERAAGVAPPCVLNGERRDLLGERLARLEQRATANALRPTAESEPG